MADQDLRIKVSAETGAAQDAIGKLADEMGGLARASDKAGTEQQKLARQTAETAQKVEAARQAVERAKRAQQEAGVVAQAFGKDSREAAEAQIRLKAAEEAATKAARESEGALKGAAEAISTAAKTADDRAMPALRRMTDQLQRAGKESEKAAQDLRLLEARTISAAKATNGLTDRVDAARDAQADAAAATARARIALVEHNAVVAKHGIKSDEAARSLKKLEAAQHEATSETLKADRALEAAARAIDRVGTSAEARAAHGLDAMERELRSVGTAADATSRDLGKIDRALDATARNAADATRAKQQFTKQLGVTGTAIGTFAGTLAGQLTVRGFDLVRDSMGGAAKAAIDFESGMADIKKVLPDGTTAAQVAAIDTEMKRIASTVGVLPQDVAKLTANLAQAGIAGDDLAATAEDAAKLKVAFDMTADASGDALAKLRTSLGLSRAEVNSLTGTINELSNKFAATAPEIINAELRVASLAKAAGVTAESAAALATAMIASGANADQAATGVKNFVATLASGQAATKLQREAFAALGLDAVEVAKRMAAGGKSADAVFVDVVKRLESLGKKSKEQVLPVMIELFGRETMGTIGPLATQVELLGNTLAVAGNKTAALNSVQAEYEARSKTTASAIGSLRAQAEVLAIQFGDALLPHIRKIVAFLSSKEGQDWGREAVQKAVTVVEGLASAVKSVGAFMGAMVDKLGSVGVAAGALGVAVMGLTGPFGKALAAGTVMGAGIAAGLDSVFNATKRAEQGLLDLHHKAEEIRSKELAAEVELLQADLDHSAGLDAQARRVQAATDRWEALERARRKVKAGSEEDLEITRKAARQRESIIKGGFTSKSFDERIASFERSLEPAVETPGLAPKKEKKGKAAKEEKVTRISDAGLMNVSRAFVDPMQEAERAIAAYEAESAARDKALAGMEREVEALEARGIAESETVDMIFFQVEIESEAQRQRDALIDQRIDGELKLAMWQRANAKTQEQREKAQTRLETAEHAKRLHVLRRTAAQEAKEHQQRQRVVEQVLGAVQTLGGGMVDAFERMAAGEKGAIASMLSELLKGVAKKHAILALGEAALAIGAAASYRYAAAAQHGTAAALHTGVAIAAGAGAAVSGAVASQRGAGAGEGKGSSEKAAGVGKSSDSGSSDGLEQQEVPLTHEQLRRGDPSMRRGAEGGGVTINLQVGSIVGAGGVREVADMIRREFDRQDRGGKRARL